MSYIKGTRYLQRQSGVGTGGKHTQGSLQDPSFNAGESKPENLLRMEEGAGAVARPGTRLRQVRHLGHNVLGDALTVTSVSAGDSARPWEFPDSRLHQVSAGGILRGSGQSPPGPWPCVSQTTSLTAQTTNPSVLYPYRSPLVTRSWVTGWQRWPSCAPPAITLKGLPLNDSSICCQSIRGAEG